MKKLISLVVLLNVAAVSTAFAEAREAATLYNQSCIACHVSGAAGAPKTGDVATWKARLEEKGMETLVANARKGINAMPPKGMCMDCTDEEFKLLIEYMAAPKK